MNKSFQQYTSGRNCEPIVFVYCFFFVSNLDSWIDIQSDERIVLPPNQMMSSFADRDLTTSMHINENLLLEAQKESSRVSSKASTTNR